MIVDLNGPVNYAVHEGPADAPQVVYVHGLGGSLLNWSELAPLMSEQVRGVSIDLPGFGQSPSAGRSTSVAANAQVLRDFLRTIGNGPSVLVGNSMGGLISTLVGAAEPELVSALVLIDPTLPLAAPRNVSPEVRRAFIVGGIPVLGEYLLHRRYATVPARQRVGETLRNCCVDPGRIPASMFEALVSGEETLTVEGGRRHAADYLGAARSIVRDVALADRAWSRLRRLSMPVLLLHGTHDRLVPISSAHAVAKRFPHWSFIELDSGHIPHMEHPQEVAGELTRWLATTPVKENHRA